MGFAGDAVVVAAGRPSQSSTFECDESQTARYSAPFDPRTPPPPLSFPPFPGTIVMGIPSRVPRPSPHDRLLPPLAIARLHLVPPLLFPNGPLLSLSPSPPSPPLPLLPFPPLPLFPSSPLPLPPTSPLSPASAPQPLRHPHGTSPTSPLYLATCLCLAMGNLWEQLSKARLHLAEAMALARHWGRTLVLPRVCSSHIGGNNLPRGMIPACAYFDMVGADGAVCAVGARGVSLVPAWEGRGGASSGEREMLAHFQGHDNERLGSNMDGDLHNLHGDEALQLLHLHLTLLQTLPSQSPLSPLAPSHVPSLCIFSSHASLWSVPFPSSFMLCQETFSHRLGVWGGGA
ncbi:unnamed protein product [Closterium sp. NIES-64]|nr:unnamed protein product [Closterium sp. NIES-64]